MSQRAPAVLCLDAAYLSAALVTVTSAAEHCRDLRWVVVTASGGAQAARVLHTAAAEVGIAMDIRVVEQPLGPVPDESHITPATYLRLRLPDLLHDETSALYLDCDLLVKGDLGELLDGELADHAVTAATDMCHPTWTHHPDLRKTALEAEGARPYFNAGVMLMNLDRWRADEIGARALAFAQANPQGVRFVDQDALNVVLAGRWTWLNERWNVLPVTDYLRCCGYRFRGRPIEPEAMERRETTARVLHFAGALKPWHSAYPDGPNKAAYLRASSNCRRLLPAALRWPSAT
jgi:lipopolysaccharide biosynthesis glycosyltransferase